MQSTRLVVIGRAGATSADALEALIESDAPVASTQGRG